MRTGFCIRGVSGASALLVFASAAALLLTAPVASAREAQGGSGYLIQQRAAGTILRVVLSPSGLRMDVSAPARASRAGKHVKVKPMVGMIVTYRDGRLVALDPAQRTYQALPLMSTVSSYEAAVGAPCCEPWFSGARG